MPPRYCVFRLCPVPEPDEERENGGTRGVPHLLEHRAWRYRALGLARLWALLLCFAPRPRIDPTGSLRFLQSVANLGSTSRSASWIALIAGHVLSVERRAPGTFTTLPRQISTWPVPEEDSQ